MQPQHKSSLKDIPSKTPEITEALEKTLEKVSSGEEKLVKYESVDEYIKHAKQVLED